MIRQQETDVFSEILTSLQVAHSGIIIFEFSAPWAIKIPSDVPACCTVTDGSVWLTTPDKKVREYMVGDTFLLPYGCGSNPYFLSSSKERPASWIEGNQTPALAAPNPVEIGQDSSLRHFKTGGGGVKAKLLSFGFSWKDESYRALPEIIQLNANHSGLKLLKILNRFIQQESQPMTPGYNVFAAQAAQLFLIHVIRSYMTSSEEKEQGWLKALQEPKIARVLASLHKDPGHKWSVAEMAKIAGMSRSLFATKFVDIVQETPMDYLCHWRMHLAKQSLAKREKSVITLANELGYQSEAAFRKAFKNTTGKSPREYIKSPSDIPTH